MIGGNGITIKKLYAQPYTIDNKCKLILSCNRLPSSGDKTDGLYRRMLIVPFEAKFTDDIADKHIQSKLDLELSGIFNRIVKAYHYLLKSKEFTESEDVRRQLEDYREENDNLIIGETRIYIAVRKTTNISRLILKQVTIYTRIIRSL